MNLIEVLQSAGFTDDVIESAQNMQLEMHKMIADAMAKNKSLTYQECVNAYLLCKLAEVRMIASSRGSRIV